MLEDIRVFKAAGTDGVVLGILTADGKIDAERTTKLVREAFPLQVCFHRAFDMTRDPLEAFEAVCAIPGITRILTSGHGVKAPSSLAVLKSLLSSASGKGSNGVKSPAILPGSGINASTVHLILEALLPLGLREIHLSAGEWLPSGMIYQPTGMGMGVGGEGEWGIWRTSPERVKEVRRIVDSA